MKTIGKRILVFFCTFALMAGLIPAPAEAAMLDMTRYNDKIVSVEKVPKGEVSKNIKIPITIHNIYEEDLESLRIQLCDEDEYREIYEDLLDYDEEEDEDDDSSNNIHEFFGNFPFEVNSSTFEEKMVGDVKKGAKKTVTFTFKVRRDLTPGYYQAFFHLRSKHRYFGDFGVNIWVGNTTGDSDDDEDENKDYPGVFSIGDGQFTPYASYGQVMNFGVNFTNIGGRTVYDVRIEMQLDPDVSKFPFDINEGNYRRDMGDMSPGAVVTAPYSMAVREDVKSGFFPIHYHVYYRETEGGSFEGPVDLIYYVRVRGEDDDKIASDAGENERTKARIIVESFSTSPEKVYAGVPFTLNVRMKNASSNIPASNIMFTFKPEENNGTPVFSSDGGSTSLVVNNLAPGTSSDISIRFLPSPVAEQKSYKVTIKEQYDSPEFKNASEEVNISVPVYQEARLGLSTIEVMPADLQVGSESNVMFGINNTGKAILYNVTAHFQADSINPVDAYVGNIKPGETGNVDTMLTAAAPTTDTGIVKIIISYEDENGTVSEVEKQMTLQVREPEPDFYDEPEEVPEPEKPGIPNSWKIGGGVGALLLAAIGIRAFRRWKRKKEEEKDDELS